MELLLIRHGEIQGNKEQRYIGCRTDQPLLPASLDALRKRYIAPVQALYTSPMIRCKQTAGALFPGMTPTILEDLRECDFGTFEGRTYEDLKDEPVYQAFLESGGRFAFPEGESTEAFQMRCLSALDQIMEEVAAKKILRAAIVTHGGTIMTLLAACGAPEKEFYDWMLPPGGAYLCRVHASVRPTLLKVIDDADVTDELTLRQFDR